MKEAKRAGVFLLAIGLLFISVWGLRLGFTLRDAYANLTRLQELAQEPDINRLDELCGSAGALAEDLKTVKREAGFLLSLAPSLSWIPERGSDLKALPLLFQIALDLSEAGAEICRPFEEVVSFSPENALPIIISGGIQWGKALALVQEAARLWKEVERLPLSPSLEARLRPLRKTLPLAETGLSLLKILPQLLGADGPRVYLILAQNEDELRPTGGFITGVGEARVEGGKIVSLTFRDSYAVDDFSLPYPDPPEPLRRYMGIDLWVFRDSNWSPDFPTSARKAVSLYRPGYPVKVDGVIALDQEAVRRVVEALGPLALEEGKEPITGRNIISFMRQAWAPEGGKLTKEWWLERKTFMALMAEAILRKVEGGGIDWLTLARSLLSLLEEKHILIYLEDPEASRALSSFGWDGSLKPTDGDFLMVVDANLGYNKASARVRQSIAYEVSLADSPPIATLTLAYTHTAPAGYPCKPEVRYDPIYEKMMDRCYWDYIRVYVPRGSKLQDATRMPIPAGSLWHGEGESGEVTVRDAEEGPWTVMAVMSLLPPSASQTRRLTYTLPSEILAWEGEEGIYRLRVQKQPGTTGHPLRVKIRLPAGSELIEARPEPSALEGNAVLFIADLRKDREFFLRFRRQK